MTYSNFRMIVVIILLILTIIGGIISLMPQKEEPKHFSNLMVRGSPIYASVYIDAGTAFEKRANITISLSKGGDIMNICDKHSCEEFPIKSKPIDIDIEDGWKDVAERWLFYAEGKIYADWTFHENGTVTRRDIVIGTWWQ